MTLPTAAEGPASSSSCSSPTARTWRRPRPRSTRWSTIRPARGSGSRTSRRSRSAATRSTASSADELEDAFVTPFDREDIHELAARLDDVVDGIQAIAETFVHLRRQRSRPPRRKRLAAILDGQGERACRPRSASSTDQGPRAPLRGHPSSSRTRPTACPAPRSRASSDDELDADRGHQVARPVHRSREHHRRRRGRGRGHGADVPQGQLSDVSPGRSCIGGRRRPSSGEAHVGGDGPGHRSVTHERPQPAVWSIAGQARASTWIGERSVVRAISRA